MRHTVFLHFENKRIRGLVCANEKNGSAHLRHFALSISSPEDAALPERLSHAFQEKKAFPEQCILLLQRHELGLVKMRVPSCDPEELHSVIAHKLSHSVPLRVEEIAFGWENLVESEDLQLLQIYWSPLQQINSRIEILQRAGLRKIAIQPSLPYYRHLLFPEGKRQLVRLTPSGYEFIHWGRSGEVIFSRGQGICSEEGDGSNLADDLVRNLAATLQTWRESFGQIDESECAVISSPQWAESDVLLEFSKTESAAWDLETQDEVSPDELAEIFPLLAARKSFFSEPAPQRGHASWLTLDMLPQDLKQAQQHSLRRRLTLQAAISATAVLLLAITNIWFLIHSLNDEWQENLAQINLLKPRVKEVEAMEERLASIRRQMEYGVTPLDSIYRLNSILAEAAGSLEGLYLDKMEYNADGAVTIEGHCTNDISPWRFSEYLSAGGAFRVVEAPRFDFQKFGGTRAIRFMMRLQAATIVYEDAKPQLQE